MRFRQWPRTGCEKIGQSGIVPLYFQSFSVGRRFAGDLPAIGLLRAGIKQGSDQGNGFKRAICVMHEISSDLAEKIAGILRNSQQDDVLS